MRSDQADAHRGNQERAPAEPPMGDRHPRRDDSYGRSARRKSSGDDRSRANTAVEEWPAADGRRSSAPSGVGAARRGHLIDRVPRSARWAGGILLALLTLGALISALMDEPLRRITERRMNERLTGYSVRLGALVFHPLGFSIDLGNLLVTQNAAPDPPVISIPRLHASVQWRELLRARLVADFVFDRPVLKLNFVQAKAEAQDPVPVTQHGWQDAVQAAYPLKINRLVIADGDLTYTDDASSRPIRITQLEFEADNIRNIRSREGTYPSPFRLEGVLLDTAKLRADGHADFLAEPSAAVRTDFAVDGLRLDYLQPALRHANVTVRKGTLSASGTVEYTAKKNEVSLKTLQIDEADLEYRYVTDQPTPEKEVAKKASEGATQSADQSNALVQAERIAIRRSTFGVLNATTDPRYRVFVDVDQMNLRDFSNRPGAKPMLAELRGKFMGTGDARVDATFRPEKRGPDFELAVGIDDTDLRSMNDLLRTYAGFDVARGRFSLYSELHVRGTRVEGYVKPFFIDIDVYDRDQDRDKPLPKQLYEGLAGGLATLLENRSHEQVATETSVSGELGDVKLSTWETLARLMQNAFFKAILPGLKHELGRT